MAIEGHIARIKRISKSHSNAPGRFQVKCECGEFKVTFGHANAARWLNKHHKEVTETAKQEPASATE